MPALSEESTQLNKFFDIIYGDAEGIAYVATKPPGNMHQFKQEFFKWPEQRGDFIERILKQRAEWEVYFGPSLYSSAEAKKQNVKGSYVLYTEFDGNTPKDLQGIPEPSIRVRSSDETHEHWYWRLDSFMDAGTIERINRKITYLLGADSSSWDSTQILRPPSTLNHKRQREVKLIKLSSSTVSTEAFEGLPDPPPLIEIPIPDNIPQVNDVIAKYEWPKAAWNLFKNGAEVGKRSSALMALGYYCAEMKMTNEEMLSILLNLDERVGKFAKRQDQVKRLLEIVTIARQKYPFVVSETKEETKLISLGFQSLLTTNVHLEWVWEGFLQKQGYMLLSGPSGVGKTQFALDFSSRIALGRHYLDRPTKKSKIGFFSLEMGLIDLKHFLLAQSAGYKPGELEELERSLRFYPLGEPLYLNRPAEKQRIEAAIDEEGLDGIIVDSLGSTTEGELSEEKDVKNLFDWNDRLRQERGVFTVFIHHHRKASGDNKKPNKLSDVFGSQYITARATTVLALWDSGITNTLDILPLKVRLSQKPDKFSIVRDTTLRFTKKADGLVKKEPKEQKEPTEQEQAVAEAKDEQEKTGEVTTEGGIGI